MRSKDMLMRLGVTAGLLLVLGLSVLVFELYYSSRVDPHISVDGIPIGGVALDDVPAYLQRSVDDRNSQPLTFRAADRVYHVTKQQFHTRYNLAPAIASVRNAGHSGNIVSRVWNQLSTLVTGHDYPLKGSHDSAAVQTFVSKVAKDMVLLPRPAQVGVENGKVTVASEPVLGRRLDVPATVQLVNKEINQHSALDINLPIQYPSSPITHDVAQKTVDQAQTLLSQNVFFSSLNKVKAWYLKPGQLLQLLTFKPGYDAHKGWSIVMGIDTKKLAITMRPIAKAVEHAPIPAYFRFVDAANGQPDTAVPYADSPGLAIDIEKAAQVILVSPSNGHVAVIPFEHPHSKFTLQSARAMGFDTLQSKVVYGLDGSSKTRLANAKVAVQRLNNVRLKPGQALSVTSVISPVVRANGFVPDLGGFDLKYDITGVNSGVSATASALFEAVYDAGLPIVRRAVYPNVTVSNGLPGTDAMVQARVHGAGLVFLNNTKHTILIGLVMQGSQIKGYIFNNASVVRKTDVSAPTVTLNQDGSVDAQLSRTISGDTSSQDQLASHYQNVDPYP